MRIRQLARGTTALGVCVVVGCAPPDSPGAACALEDAAPIGLGEGPALFSPEAQATWWGVYLAVDVGAMDTSPDDPPPSEAVPSLATTPASFTLVDVGRCVSQTWTVELRYKGNTTFDKPKRQYKVKFDKDAELFGLRTLNLHSSWKDATLFRERLAAELMAAMGVPAPRATHVEVYLQDTGGGGGYTYQGLYTAVEQVDKVFLAERYGEGQEDGYLYKGYYGWKGSSGAGFADLRVVGDGSPGQYRGGNGWADTYEGQARAYRLKTHEEEGMEDYADLAALIQTINTGDEAALSAAVDVEGYLRWLAANTLLGGWDNYWWNAQNYYLYQAEPGAPWRWIPWDHDNSLGNNFQDHKSFHIETQDIYYPSFPNNVLTRRVLAVPAWRETYEQHLREGLGGWFTPMNVSGRLAWLRAQVGEAAARDPLKQYSNAEQLGNQGALVITHSDEDGDFGNQAHHLGILDYVTKRSASVREQLGEE